MKIGSKKDDDVGMAGSLGRTVLLVMWCAKAVLRCGPFKADRERIYFSHCTLHTSY